MGQNEPVWESFVELVRRWKLVEAGQTVVVGVSGGPDSQVLLHLLRRLATEESLPLRLICAHLDHGLRPESSAEAEMVRRLAADWEVEYVADRVNVSALMRESGLSMEEAARQARYRFLVQAAQAYGASVIAVGHHADDQAETVLMHWLRGAGLAGLRGMLPATSLTHWRLGPAPVEHALRLIRPLLACRRCDIETYAAAHVLEPLRDSSNQDTTIYRNRLRHEALPYLEQINPNLRAVLARSADVLAQDYDYLHAQVLLVFEKLGRPLPAGAWAFERAGWLAQHPSIQRGMLREAISRLRWSLRNIGFVHVEDALQVAAGHTGQQATLPQGLMLAVGYRTLWVGDAGWQPPLEDAYPALSQPLPVSVPGRLALENGWTLETKREPLSALEAAWQENDDPWTAFLDAGFAPLERLLLRPRRPGDRFQPLGLAGHSKDVRELLIQAKVPQAARALLPVLVWNEQVVWLPGLRVSQQARLTKASSHALALRMCPPGTDRLTE